MSDEHGRNPAIIVVTDSTITVQTGVVDGKVTIKIDDYRRAAINMTPYEVRHLMLFLSDAARRAETIP